MMHKATGAMLVAALAWGGAAAAQEPERWRGEVDLSAAGAPNLELFVEFVNGDDGATATITIPAQGVQNLPLTAVTYTAERLEFTLAVTPAAVFGADRDGDEAEGFLEQGGGRFPVSLSRVTDEEAAASRPQMPQPPFPYASHDVTYDNPAEGNTLAGTLTVPEGEGPHPAALLITGSGSQDRDETIFGHKPFWVIADHLSRRGMAVLRVDDRGVGGSSGARPGLTSADFAGDVAAGVAWLRARPEIDPDRVGLIGHSEGGIIAPMVAAEDQGIAFIVLLAGTGVDGLQVLRLQNELLLRAAGLDDEGIDRRLAAQEPLWQAMAAGADRATLEPLVTRMLEAQFEGSGLAGEAREQAWQSAYTTALAQAESAWFSYFLRTDPAPFLRRVQCPVLVLNGALDLQVDSDQNLPAIAAALEDGGNEDVTVRRFDGLNHLFQTATTGAVSEYGSIEETIAPEVLVVLAEWLQERVGE